MFELYLINFSSITTVNLTSQRPAAVAETTVGAAVLIASTHHAWKKKVRKQMIDKLIF
jgi:hypothetical protein